MGPATLGTAYILLTVHAEGLDLFNHFLFRIERCAVDVGRRSDLVNLIANGVEKLGHIVWLGV